MARKEERYREIKRARVLLCAALLVINKLINAVNPEAPFSLLNLD